MMRCRTLCVLFALLLCVGLRAGDTLSTMVPATVDTLSRNGEAIASRQEHRGVWLATVARLDWPKDSSHYFEHKKDLINTINSLAKIGCNTLYFQVVSQMDAMYSSDILPWCQNLTGSEGVLPYFDPLSIAVKVAHENNMSIHAWINPLRVTGPDTLCNRSSGVKASHPEWVQSYEGKDYLDPGNPEVVDFVCSIAREILTKYDVDGIHIDDYFYPWGLRTDHRSQNAPGAWNDAALFERYGQGKTLEEWRFCNIDKLVSELHKTVHDSKEGAVFGVSPQGRVINTAALYADPRRWVQQGSIDYIIPQLYWSMDRGDAAAFPRALLEWKDLADSVSLYIGLAAYKHDPLYYRRKVEAGFKDVHEFSRQIELLRSTPYVSGHVWFRTDDLLQKEDLRELIVSEIYKSLSAEAKP